MEHCRKKGLFYPDILFENIYEITPEFLLLQQIRGLILDLDNTVAPYEIPLPDEQMTAWFRDMQTAGIRMAFVSNNHGDRVTNFSRTWGIPQISDAKKPSPSGMRDALAQLQLTTAETVSVGDQIFTDCVASHRAGLRFYLVPPICDKKTLFFRTKRFLERPFVGAFQNYPTYLAKKNPCRKGAIQ